VVLNLCKVHVWTGSGTLIYKVLRFVQHCNCSALCLHFDVKSAALASDRRGCFDIGENLYGSMYEILKVHLTVSARMVRKV